MPSGKEHFAVPYNTSTDLYVWAIINAVKYLFPIIIFVVVVVKLSHLLTIFYGYFKLFFVYFIAILKHSTLSFRNRPYTLLFLSSLVNRLVDMHII